PRAVRRRRRLGRPPPGAGPGGLEPRIPVPPGPGHGPVPTRAPRRGWCGPRQGVRSLPDESRESGRPGRWAWLARPGDLRDPPARVVIRFPGPGLPARPVRAPNRPADRSETSGQGAEVDSPLRRSCRSAEVPGGDADEPREMVGEVALVPG